MYISYPQLLLWRSFLLTMNILLTARVFSLPLIESHDDENSSSGKIDLDSTSSKNDLLHCWGSRVSSELSLPSTQSLHLLLVENRWDQVDSSDCA